MTRVPCRNLIFASGQRLQAALYAALAMMRSAIAAKTVEQIIELENRGIGSGFDLALTTKKIGTYWP
jgi:hypothetical protein